MTDYVNISDMNLSDEPMEFTPEADLNPSMKVPDGSYLVSLSLGKLGIFTTDRNGNPFVDENRKPFFKAHVSAQIIAPGTRYDRNYVSGFLSSKLRKNPNGERTSEIINMVKGVTGSTVAAGTSQAELSRQVASLLASPVQCQISTRWEAVCKNSEDAPQGKEWIRVKGMRKFPSRPDGSYIPVVEVELANGVHTRLEARETITDFSPATNATSATN